MLSLGRALIINPEMLLMDEPSLGLSPKLVKFMMGHIRKINRLITRKTKCRFYLKGRNVTSAMAIV